MTAFRPQYIDGDVEGLSFFSLYPFLGRGGIDYLRTFFVGRARIHLSLERWRVCETWFAPSMAGVDSAGLGEVLQNVLASFPIDDRGLLVQVRYPTPPLSLLSDLVFPMLTNLFMNRL